MNNTKNTIRLTESQLHNIIKESVKQVLREQTDNAEYNAILDLAFKMAHHPDGFSAGMYYFRGKAKELYPNVPDSVISAAEDCVRRDREQYLYRYL